MSFFSRLAAALARAFGALQSGTAFMWGAITEAAEPITRRLPLLGAGAAYAGAGLALAGDKALGLPGRILGSLLPAGALTPKAVADHAVAQDDVADIGGGGVTTSLYGSFVAEAAAAVRDRDGARLAQLTPYVGRPVVEWLQAMSPSQLQVAASLDPADLKRHVENEGTVTPGIPTFSTAAPAPIPTLTAEERRRIVAAARSSLRESEDAARAAVEEARETEYRQATRRALPGRPIGRPGYVH